MYTVIPFLFGVTGCLLAILVVFLMDDLILKGHFARKLRQRLGIE